MGVSSTESVRLLISGFPARSNDVEADAPAVRGACAASVVMVPTLRREEDPDPACPERAPPLGAQ